MAGFHAPASAARFWFFAPPAGSRKRILLPHGGLQCIADFLTITSLPLLGSLLCQTTESLVKNLSFWSLLALFSVLLTASHGGYSARATHQIKAQANLAAGCFLATSLGMLTLAVILGHPNILTRHWVVLDVIITPFLLIGTRTHLAPKFAEAAYRPTEPGTLVICHDNYPLDLPKALAAKNLPEQIGGIFYLAAAPKSAHPHEWPVLSNLAALQTKLRERSVRDVVFIHHPTLDHHATHNNLWEEVLAYSTRIWLGLDVASNLPEMLREKSGGCQLLPIVTDELLSANNHGKRAFDIAAATILLFCVAPFMFLCALAIRATSPGPILFRQQRTGAHGHEFEVLKFRTMRHDPGRAFAQAHRNDPHITKIGAFLRRTSLDELPQLFNVIRGDMSLVGPRPHAPETQVEGMSFENALQLYQIRHRVKPGMTGLAQIRGLRGATPALKHLEQRLSSDLEYIQSWSIWLDFSILAQTLPAIMLQTNAC